MTGYVQALLETRDLEVAYGRIQAVRRVSIAVGAGEVVAVLGANGAGKSSLLKSIFGLVAPRAGKVEFFGRELPPRSAHARVAGGLALVPEGRQILVSLTVDENLRLGAYGRRDDTGLEKDLEAVYARFSNLDRRRHLSASTLSGGEQQMLAIGRALMARPSLLMLDEPSLGLSPRLVGELFDLLRGLNREGLGILLVEQNTHKALQIAHRAYVLELGRCVAEGTPEQLREDGKIEEAYLGQDGAGRAPAPARPPSTAGSPGPARTPNRNEGETP